MGSALLLRVDQVIEQLRALCDWRLARRGNPMPSDWRGLVRFTNIVGGVWPLLALAILGSFASLAIQILRQG